METKYTRRKPLIRYTNWLSLRVSDKMYEALCKLADERETTISDVVRDVLGEAIG